MITITKNGNAVLFEFEENQHYLYNGTIEVPLNSLSLVTDESEMFTFKKAATNDIFISARYDDVNMSKSQLIDFYIANMVGSTGGGSESGITSGDVQTMIDTSLEDYYDIDEIDAALSGKADTTAVTEAINSAVSGKADTSAVTEAITAAVSGKADTTAVTEAINSAVSGKADSSAVTEAINSAVSGKADTSAVTASIQAAVSGKQDTLIAGSGITISGNVISSEGGSSINVVQTTGSSTTDVMSQNAVTDAFNTYTSRTDADEGITRFWTWQTPNHPYGANNLYNFSINGKLPLSKQTWRKNTDYNNIFNFHLVETSAITSSVTSASTDSQVPSAKAVYDALQESGGGGVSESAFTAYSAATDARISEDEEVTAAALNALNDGKQDTLIAGSGITISGNVISAEGGNLVIELTQAEYDALVDKDPNAFYIITDATEINISDYYTSAQTQSAINAAVSGKQDTLIAGSGITISGNVISANGGGSITVDTALDSGSTNPVENRVIYDKFDEVEQVTAAALNDLNDKFDGLRLKKLTQAEYDALSPNYDSNTLYVIVN